MDSENAKLFFQCKLWDDSFLLPKTVHLTVFYCKITKKTIKICFFFALKKGKKGVSTVFTQFIDEIDVNTECDTIPRLHRQGLI